MSDESLDFPLGFESTSSGVDNCVTHHICGKRNLFTKLPIPLDNIGVKGTTGSLPVEGIDTMSIKSKDDAGMSHDIALNKVIFLPSAAKT